MIRRGIMQKYNAGDLVKIKDIDRLREELGDPIVAKCGWVSGIMDDFAGGTYEVLKVLVKPDHCSYHLAKPGCGSWYFSDETIEEDEYEEVSFQVHMSYEDLEELMGK